MDIEEALWLVVDGKTDCTLKKCKDCSVGESCKFHNQRADGFIELLRELQQYRKIGTVDECMVAREKQIAKTPDYEGDGYSEGKLILDTWICPNCGRHYEVGYHDYEYCPHCGQHILHADWEK